MRRAQLLSAAMVGLLALVLSACGSSNTTSTTVSITPAAAVVVLGGQQQFTGVANGPSDTTVTWSISGTSCSANACGTINSNGLYTAPSVIFTPNTLTVTATSVADPKATATASVTVTSGVRVQLTPSTASIGTSEQISLAATVTGSTNTGVTWAVNGTPNGDTADGLICVVGSSPCQAPTTPVDTIYYLAPAITPASGTESVVATSVADPTQSATISVNVQTAVDPVISSISPPQAAQGAVFQDVYVNVQSPSVFFSTSTLTADGQAIATSFVSNSLLRGRVPAGLLQQSGSVQIAVQRQNGDVSNSLVLQVVPQRPEIISYSPVSVPQCPSGSCGAAALTLDGGYLTPSTVVQFNGQTIGSKLIDPNELSVNIPGSALAAAGLYQLTASNPGAALPESAVNVAVLPNLSANPPQILTTTSVGVQPSAVAVDVATGVAVVANTGSNSISLINLNSCTSTSCPATSIPVGKQPTGVAVDPLRDLAFVVNQVDNTLSVVDLSGANPTQTIALPSGYVPVSVGENPLTEHLLVANQETNTVTVVDLSQSPAVITSVDVTQGGTRAGGTGYSPRVTIVPRLDWAIVTPGGSGAIVAVDMSHKVISPSTGFVTYNIAFSYSLSTTATGIAYDPINDELLITDPNNSVATNFNLLNEAPTQIPDLGYNNIAAAVNPLTDAGLIVSSQTDSVQLVNLQTNQVVGSPITLGNSPVDVAFDPSSDLAVIPNQGDGTVSVLSLGALRPLSIVQTSPAQLFSSSGSQTVTFLGGGFQSGAVVRVDGTALPASAVQYVTSREVTVTLPASLLSGPRMLNLDVQNPDGTISGVAQVPVIQAVSVGTSPVAVSIDPDLNMAVVTNSGSSTVSLVDLANGTVTSTVNVGASPEAVGVIPRLGLAVVANNADNTASIVNLVTPASSVVPIGQGSGSAVGPIAVDVDQDTAQALIANETSNNVTLVNVASGTFSSLLTVDQGPLGVAIDPALGLAAVLCSTQSPATIDIVNVANSPAFITAHLTGANLPIGVALDAGNDHFLVADSAGNRVIVVDPQTATIVQNIGTGVDPTSIAYNPQALEALTINTASHTASIIEINPNGSNVSGLLSLDGSSQQSVAIDPLTNLAVVADQANNRVLLVPLPH